MFFSLLLKYPEFCYNRCSLLGGEKNLVRKTVKLLWSESLTALPLS